MPRHLNGEAIDFSTKDVEKVNIYMQKNEVEPLSTLYTKLTQNGP